MSRIYVDGVFDLFHVGHLNLLKNAKKHGDILVVGIISDKDTESYKRTPIINHKNRISMLKYCSLVDEVIENPPLLITQQFIIDNKIDLVIHADDSKQEEFFKVPIELGIMKYVPYTKSISTTMIINKIATNNY
tara:strand:- start:716 stop:1117 length:402 start_codon:yes stop_codon:yes gene_type:complete